MKRLFFTISFITVFLGNIGAQSGYSMRSDSLQSAILGQNRKLNIFLPEGYDTVKHKFPVIYVLDGASRDEHIVPTIRFLNQNAKMPQAIVVGILNIDRNHDFLADSTKGAPTGGGADNFIRFFREELFPYIDRNYKSEPYKVLIGHSYGGWFALYALLGQPDLFDGYIAMDPSVWYHDKALINFATAELARQKNWEKPVFITGREGDGMDEMGIPPLEALLKKSAPAELRWKIAAYPYEDHGSVTFKSAYDGLRFIFDAGGSIEVYPQSGIIPDKKTFSFNVLNANPDLRYTTDGTEPVAWSSVCSRKIVLKGACTVKIRDVAKKYRNYPGVTFTFSGGKFLDNEKSPAGLKAGLNYSYYEGIWDSLPDFTKLTPVKTGVTETINPDMAARKDSFALKFEGYLLVKEEAMYNVWVMSDEDARIYINGKPVVENTGPHSAEFPKIAILPLKAGYYPIAITYFEKTGRESVMAGMLRDGAVPDPAPFAKEILFHKDAAR